jgi:cytochrome bd-type quinol oxidase subunit 2
VRPPPPTAAEVQRAKRKVTSWWLAAFVVLPLGVWFTSSQVHGFEGKSISNLSLEPLLVLIASCLLFFAWRGVARAGPKPLVGIILLVILSAGAYAIHHFVPGLRE